MSRTEIVWLTERRQFAILKNMGAHYSVVLYTQGGIDYELVIENNEWEFWEEHANDYESE